MNKHPTTHHLATRAVHAGLKAPHPDFLPTATPLYHSVTYHYPHMEDLDAVFAGARQGYVYTRHGIPTVAAFEEAVTTLEEGEAAIAFASGMAAIHAALLATGVRTGGAVVAAQELYGTTYSLLDHLFRELGVRVRFCLLYTSPSPRD